MKKKLSIIIILNLFFYNINAQVIFDALHFSNNSINGSARYTAMAGSFGAIGGDISATVDNPAALGIFRSSEISATLSIAPAITKSSWQENKFSSGITKINLNNLGVTFFIPSYKENGYLYTNLGFGYHKIKNLRRNIYLQGNSDISLTDLMAKNLNNRDIFENDLSDINAYDNIRLDWLSILGYDAYLINPLYDENGVHHGQWNSILGENEQVIPKYSATESTDIEEYNFTYSGNINDVFYFGTGISLQHFSYKIESAYSEFFQNHGDNFDLKNQLTTNGNGVNLKIGAIVRATKFLRFGLSFQTPTWYGLRNWHFGELEYSQNASAVSTPEADYTYQFGTPLKAQASVGFILGKKAAVNIDYQFSGKKYTLSDDYSRTDIDPNNDAKYTHAVKLGAEIRLGKYYKIRGGGAFFSAPVKQNAFKYFPNYTTRTDMEYFVPKNTYYGTCGFGYAQNSFSIDLAYAYQLQNQDFFAADIFRPTADFSGNSANIRSHSHNIILTFAMRY